MPDLPRWGGRDARASAPQEGGDIRPGYSGELDGKIERLEGALESIRQEGEGGATLPE